MATFVWQHDIFVCRYNVCGVAILPLDQSELREFLSVHNTAWAQVFGQAHRVPGEELCLRVKDIGQHAGVTLRLPSPGLSQEDTLARGHFFGMELRRGLSLHYSDAQEQPYATLSSQPAGLSCMFLLNGEMDITVGGRKFAFNGLHQGGSFSAISVFKTAEVPLERKVHQTQRVRKLILHATPEWLRAEGQDVFWNRQPLEQLIHEPMAAYNGSPTPRQQQIIQEMFNPAVHNAALLPLYLESRVIEILAESLSVLISRNNTQAQHCQLKHHDQVRLQRARDLIAQFDRGPLTVDIIARETGISASGLQKLFRRAEGVSVFEYVRRTRLQQAMLRLQSGQMSVQAVSELAGYKSPENFATAFKRQFGITPREASRS